MAKRTQKSILKQRLKNLEGEILDLKTQTSSFDVQSVENLEKIAELEERRTRNLQKYYDLQKEIKESLNKTETSTEKHQKASNKAKERSIELEEKSLTLIKSFSENTQKSAQILGIAANQASQLVSKMDDLEKMTASSDIQAKALEKTLSHTVKNANSLDDLSAKILENMDNMAEKGYELIDTYTIERQLKEQIARLDLNAVNLGVKRYAIQREALDNQLKEFENLKKVNKKLAEKGKLLSDAKENSKTTKAAFIGMVTAFPVGKFLFDKMGLGKVIDGSKTIGQTIKGWGASLKGFAIAAPFAALLGILNLIVMAFKMIIGAAFELDTRIANLSKNLSISRGEATRLEGKFAGMALKMNLVGINTEQFGETVGFLAEEYGASVNKIMEGTGSSRFVENITVLREKFQLTNEEALNFGKISSIMGVSMGNLAYQSVKITKAFLNNRQIIKAMANVPQIMANGMKGAVDKLVQFVAKAKMLGIDLKGFSEAIEGTLDIESSLEKQFTAETITGIHFNNMDAIRLATNSMQYDKAFDMIMSNIGDIRSLADMPGGLIGVRSIADLFGFSLEEFTKMFNKFKELKNVFGGANPMEQAQKYFNMTAAQLRKEVSTMGKGAKKTFLENLAAEKEGADIQTKFMDGINKIKLSLMGSTLPIVQELHSIFDSLIKNPELKKIFKDLTSSLPDIIKGMIEFAHKLKAIFGAIYDFLVRFGVINEPLKEGEKRVDGMKAGLVDWNKVLMTTVGLFVGYKGLTWGIKTAFEAFKSNVLGIGPITKASMEKVVQQVTSANNQMMMQQQQAVQQVQAKSLLVDQYGNPMQSSLPAQTPMTGAVPKQPGKFASFLSRNAGKLTLGGAALGIGTQFLGNSLASSGNEQAGAWTSMLGSAASMGMAGAALGPWGIAGGALLGLGMGYLQNKDSLSGSKPTFKDMKGNARMPAATPETAAQLSETAKELQKFNDKKIWEAARAINEVKNGFAGLNTSLQKFGESDVYDVLESVIDKLNSADSSKLLIFADGLFNLAYGIGEISKQLLTIDMNKFNKLSEKITTNNQGGILSAFSAMIGNIGGAYAGGFSKAFASNSGVNTSPSNNATVTTSQGTSQAAINVNTSALEQKIDRLINIISTMANQPTYIKIGERTIEAIESEINWKRDLRVSTDNSYSGGQKSGIK